MRSIVKWRFCKVREAEEVITGREAGEGVAGGAGQKYLTARWPSRPGEEEVASLREEEVRGLDTQKVGKRAVIVTKIEAQLHLNDVYASYWRVEAVVHMFATSVAESVPDPTHKDLVIVSSTHGSGGAGTAVRS